MNKLNAYFYGYYFYFASNCEAGRCFTIVKVGFSFKK